jgi:hypothetical protein
MAIRGANAYALKVSCMVGIGRGSNQMHRHLLIEYENMPAHHQQDPLK